MKKNNRLALIYILNKGNGIGFQKRDFYEKKISFKNTVLGESNSRYYYYFSSIETDVTLDLYISPIVIPTQGRHDSSEHHPWLP